MSGPLDFSRIASVVGDPARAAMLEALMEGRALTATELSRAACITAQTASSHLGQLTIAGLVEVEKQGRHRYHWLASPKVAQMIATMQEVTSEATPTTTGLNIGPRD